MGKSILKQVQKELKEVKEERERLPEYSIFGDENWLTLDKSIEILEDLLAHPTLANLKGLIADMKYEISEIEDNYPDDTDYEVMDKERRPFQNTLEILCEIKEKRK